MSALDLNVFENRLLLAAEAARPCDFNDGSLPEHGQAIIRAETIRAALLGIPVKFLGETESRTVNIKGVGLRGAGVTVEGHLDLEHGRRSDGEPMAYLELVSCTFEGPLLFSYARIKGLSLLNSKLTHLCAHELVVEGRLDLTGLRSSEANGAESGADGLGRCWIECHGARIKGELDVSNAWLVAPPRRDSFDPDAMGIRYALDLGHCHIDGSLIISPGLRALGGVSVRLGHIDGNLRAAGSHITGIEGAAINANDCDIRGNVFLGTHDVVDGDSVPCQIVGNVQLRGSRVVGDLVLCGSHIEGGLSATDIRIGGAALLGEHNGHLASDAEIFPFSSTDEVNFYAAKIVGNLELSGAKLDAKLDAQGAEIGGTAFLNSRSGKRGGQQQILPFTAGKQVTLIGTRIVGSLVLNGAQLNGGLTATGVDIGGDAIFGIGSGSKDGKIHFFSFSSKEDLYFRNAKIKRSLDLNGAQLDGRLNLSSAEIGGDVLLGVTQRGEATNEECFPFHTKAEVNLYSAKVTGDLNMAGANLDHGLNAAHSEIGGRAFLGTTTGTHNGLKESYSFSAGGAVNFYAANIIGNVSFSGAQIEADLNLRNSKIGGDLLINAPLGQRGGENALITPVIHKLVNFSAANILGNVEMGGAELQAGMTGLSAHIGGHVLLNTVTGEKDGQAMTIPFTAKGGVDFHSMRVGGGLEMTGAQLFGGLRAIRSEFRGAAILSAVEGKMAGKSHTFPFHCSELLNLRSCNILSSLNLRGACLDKGFDATNAKIDGDVIFAAEFGHIDGEPETYPFTAKGAVALYAAVIGGNLTFLGAQLHERLFANDVLLHGNLRLGAAREGETTIKFASKKPISFSGTIVDGSFTVEGAEFDDGINASLVEVRENFSFKPARLHGSVDISNSIIDNVFEVNLFPDAIIAPVDMDLSNTKVGVLHDNNGDGFGAKVKLDLDGFTYSRASERTTPNTSLKRLWAFGEKNQPTTKRGSRIDFWRKLRLSVPELKPYFLILMICSASLTLASYVHFVATPFWPWLVASMCLFAIWAYALIDPRPKPWQQRLNWLNLQYASKKSASDEYRPAPYMQLVRSFKSIGDYVGADKILHERLRLETQNEGFFVKRGLLILHRWLFAYGLSSFRAVTVFCIFVLAGMSSVWLASFGSEQTIKSFEKIPYVTPIFGAALMKLPVLKPVLVLDSGTVASLEYPNREASVLSREAIDGDILPNERSCGLQIEPWIYALDLFIPVLDLHQETRCAVTSAPWAWPWRMGFALYAILGWIITSITILTLTGVLRRYAEQ